MRRLIVGACVAAAAVTPGAIALAHSVQNPNLPDGRLELKGNGYIDVEYNLKIKKIDYVQVYYPCRAAGSRTSKYPAFLSLDTQRHVPMHGGRASGTFTYKITDSLATKADGDIATVAWNVRGGQTSAKGLSGTLGVTVTGPSAVCPFSLTGKRLVPLLDIPGNS